MSHTWNLKLDYHRCPYCGFINECRQDYEYRLGLYQKDLKCSRCAQDFIVSPKVTPSIGPFFGSASNPEMIWLE
jgi:DNA-directed RNA polymerase subunit RPC12/RpoP